MYGYPHSQQSPRQAHVSGVSASSSSVSSTSRMIRDATAIPHDLNGAKHAATPALRLPTELQSTAMHNHGGGLHSTPFAMANHNRAILDHNVRRINGHYYPTTQPRSGGQSFYLAQQRTAAAASSLPDLPDIRSLISRVQSETKQRSSSVSHEMSASDAGAPAAPDHNGVAHATELSGSTSTVMSNHSRTPVPHHHSDSSVVSPSDAVASADVSVTSQIHSPTAPSSTQSAVTPVSTSVATTDTLAAEARPHSADGVPSSVPVSIPVQSAQPATGALPRGSPPTAQSSQMVHHPQQQQHHQQQVPRPIDTTMSGVPQSSSNQQTMAQPSDRGQPNPVASAVASSAVGGPSAVSHPTPAPATPAMNIHPTLVRAEQQPSQQQLQQQHQQPSVAQPSAAAAGVPSGLPGRPTMNITPRMGQVPQSQPGQPSDQHPGSGVPTPTSAAAAAAGGGGGAGGAPILGPEAQAEILRYRQSRQGMMQLIHTVHRETQAVSAMYHQLQQAQATATSSPASQHEFTKKMAEYQGKHQQLQYMMRQKDQWLRNDQAMLQNLLKKGYTPAMLGIPPPPRPGGGNAGTPTAAAAGQMTPMQQRQMAAARMAAAGPRGAMLSRVAAAAAAAGQRPGGMAAAMMHQQQQQRQQQMIQQQQQRMLAKPKEPQTCAEFEVLLRQSQNQEFPQWAQCSKCNKWRLNYIPREKMLSYFGTKECWLTPSGWDCSQCMNPKFDGVRRKGCAQIQERPELPFYDNHEMNALKYQRKKQMELHRSNQQKDSMAYSSLHELMQEKARKRAEEQRMRMKEERRLLREAKRKKAENKRPTRKKKTDSDDESDYVPESDEEDESESDEDSNEDEQLSDASDDEFSLSQSAGYNHSGNHARKNKRPPKTFSWKALINEDWSLDQVMQLVSYMTEIGDDDWSELSKYPSLAAKGEEACSKYALKVFDVMAELQREEDNLQTGMESSSVSSRKRSASASASQSQSTSKPKRGRGRPRKQKTESDEDEYHGARNQVSEVTPVRRSQRQRKQVSYKEQTALDDFLEKQEQEMMQAKEETVAREKIEKILDKRTVFICPETSKTYESWLEAERDNREKSELNTLEQYLVKIDKLAYKHCQWMDAIEMKARFGAPTATRRIRTFHSNWPKIEREQNVFYGGASFNPDYLRADRLLDDIIDVDPETGVSVRKFLVKWRSLSYSQCTLETEQDIDDEDLIQKYFEMNTWTMAQEQRYSRIQNVGESAKQRAEFHVDEETGKVSGGWYNSMNVQKYKNGNELRDYQVTGVNWMIFKYLSGENFILADEMGLGKTVQSTCFLQHLKSVCNIWGPFLVVAPLSTIPHWRDEMEEWTDFNVIVYHDSIKGNESRALIRENEWYFKDQSIAKNRPKFNALLTTYEIILADVEWLADISWEFCIIDEGHRLKSKDTKLFEAFKHIRCDRRALLTGTPIQNNISELFNLLHFLEPDRFDTFASWARTSLMNNNSNDQSKRIMLPGSAADVFSAQMEEEGESDNNNSENERKEEEVDEDGDSKMIEAGIDSTTKLMKLKDTIEPFVLRRLKETVEKSIPSKEETIVDVALTQKQIDYYTALLAKNREFLEEGVKSKSDAPGLINVEVQLRKVCNHPFLLEGAMDREIMEHENKDSVMNKIINASGKMILLDKLLPKLKNENHRVLIFSQMRRMLDLLADYVQWKGYQYEKFDGTVSSLERQAAIDRFSHKNSDVFVFLLTTRAGGQGLNLTSADTVIIFDSDWNPQQDLQAQARCHRIGQSKPVTVYRFVSNNTYESEMFNRASMKLGLGHAILKSVQFGEASTMSKKGDKRAMKRMAELDQMLRFGAYSVMHQDGTEAEEMKNRDIDEILAHSSRKMDTSKLNNKNNDPNSSSSMSTSEGSSVSAGAESSSGIGIGMGIHSFKRAQFQSSSEKSDFDGTKSIRDENFWKVQFAERKKRQLKKQLAKQHKLEMERQERKKQRKRDRKKKKKGSKKKSSKKHRSSKKKSSKNSGNEMSENSDSDDDNEDEDDEDEEEEDEEVMVDEDTDMMLMSDQQKIDQYLFELHSSDDTLDFTQPEMVDLYWKRVKRLLRDIVDRYNAGFNILGMDKVKQLCSAIAEKSINGVDVFKPKRREQVKAWLKLLTKRRRKSQVSSLAEDYLAKAKALANNNKSNNHRNTRRRSSTRNAKKSGFANDSVPSSHSTPSSSSSLYSSSSSSKSGGKSKKSSRKRKKESSPEKASMPVGTDVFDSSDWPAWRDSYLDTCKICGRYGNQDDDLLLCDGPCIGTFHPECAGLTQVPDSEVWFCKQCEDLKTKRLQCWELTGGKSKRFKPLDSVKVMVYNDYGPQSTDIKLWIDPPLVATNVFLSKEAKKRLKAAKSPDRKKRRSNRKRSNSKGRQNHSNDEEDRDVDGELSSSMETGTRESRKRKRAEMEREETTTNNNDENSDTVMGDEQSESLNEHSRKRIAKAAAVVASLPILSNVSLDSTSSLSASSSQIPTPGIVAVDEIPLPSSILSSSMTSGESASHMDEGDPTTNDNDTYVPDSQEQSQPPSEQSSVNNE